MRLLGNGESILDANVLRVYDQSPLSDGSQILPGVIGVCEYVRLALCRQEANGVAAAVGRCYGAVAEPELIVIIIPAAVWIRSVVDFVTGAAYALHEE